MRTWIFFYYAPQCDKDDFNLYFFNEKIKNGSDIRKIKVLGEARS